MPNENTTIVTAAIPKTMKGAAVKMAQKFGYVSLSDFIRGAIREKLELISPQGEPFARERLEDPPSVIKQLEAIRP
ncbi:hypothetical protein ES703_08285 [subsurface metagenome]